MTPPAGVVPEGTTSRPAVLGLAARAGQRRAVRLTALALGVLALALGVRDAVDDAPAGTDVRQPAPASSTPAPTRGPEPTQPGGGG